METKHLKSYAPKARRQFIDSISKRAAQLGITKSGISDIQISGSSAVIEGRAYTKKQGEQRNRLAKAVQEKGYELFIRETAYTWFNRLVAIRYMEIHDYLEHGYRVLSHPNKVGEKPEILMHASDVAERLKLDKEYIVDLQLDGNKDEELYRLILVGQCNYLNSIMPFMFEAVDGASELLLPDNLTKTDSILHDLVTDVPETDWQEIESIGWLYQFYISEYKDTVMGKVVKSEDIPAATQLFTPNWIVKYLVENSLGRQWLSTYPDSSLKYKMDYYIEPAEQSDDVLVKLKQNTPSEINPEHLKVLDPACGSGHILVEAYDVLKKIYTERLYRARDIPSHILNKNIFGLDIDIRAAQLASFALLMKARADDPLIFDRIKSGKVTLNVHSIESTDHFDASELWSGLNLDNREKKGASLGLFHDIENEDEMLADTKQLFETFQYLMSTFKQAKTLGSLIQIDNRKLNSILRLRELVLDKISDSDILSKTAGEVLLPIIQQSIVLALRYDAVIANPPYMGVKHMNSDLKVFAKKQFANSKSDLFSMFMEGGFGLLKENGYNAQINMQSWMFLSSYESLRNWLLGNKTIITMAHLGPRAFGQISGEVVQTTAWILHQQHVDNYQSTILRLITGNEADKNAALIAKKPKYANIKQSEYHYIPGSPIVYWLSQDVINLFAKYPNICDFSDPRQGMATTDNNTFLRSWHELNITHIGFNSNNATVPNANGKNWFPYNKGGDARKWFGNNHYVVKYTNNGEDLIELVTSKYPKISDPEFVIKNRKYYFSESITWTDLTSTTLSARYQPPGYIFDVSGHSTFVENPETKLCILAFLNSKIGFELSKTLNSSFHFQVGDYKKLPYSETLNSTLNIEEIQEIIEIYKHDWDMSESSWDFTVNPLVDLSNGLTLEDSFLLLSKNLTAKIERACQIENSINRSVNNALCLGEEFDTEIKTQDLTLSAKQYDAIKEFFSYVVGCIMGRYSLDRNGLMYAASGNEGFKDLEANGIYKTFLADDDGITPLASEDWLFKDDATKRFCDFVEVVWGDEALQENIDFVAKSLCVDLLTFKKGEVAVDTIRRYFSTKFFKEHCKTYKKRPIYWLFSSGKQKAFECLVYLHRYNEGTLSRMRTEYVTPLMGKYDNEITRLQSEQNNASGAELREVEKDIVSLQKKQIELRAFDEQLKHYADMRISLDLDEGVKANYGKFGALLADVKSIHGKG